MNGGLEADKTLGHARDSGNACWVGELIPESEKAGTQDFRILLYYFHLIYRSCLNIIHLMEVRCTWMLFLYHMLLILNPTCCNQDFG